MSNVAKQHGIYLIGGSFPERKDNQLFNTSVSFDPEGNIIGIHRKVHLFDIDIPGKIRFMESETLTPGDDITVLDTGMR